MVLFCQVRATQVLATRKKTLKDLRKTHFYIIMVLSTIDFGNLCVTYRTVPFSIFEVDKYRNSLAHEFERPLFLSIVAYSEFDVKKIHLNPEFLVSWSCNNLRVLRVDAACLHHPYIISLVSSILAISYSAKSVHPSFLCSPVIPITIDIHTQIERCHFQILLHNTIL